MPKARKGKPVTADSESEEYDDEISTFHRERDKIHLDSDPDHSDSSEEVDVYALDDESDDEEDVAAMKQQLRQLQRNKFKKKMDSDIEEEEEEEEDKPESTAWGSKRSWYMGGDVKDNKIILSGSEDEATAGAALLEEKEAMEIQKRHTALMSEEDFMIPTSSKDKAKKKKKQHKGVKDQDSDEEENELQSLVRSGKDGLEKVEADFSKLSRKEEQEIMKKLHPEYIPLMNDFNSKSHEMQDRILPLMGLMKAGKIQGLGAEFVRMKYHIIVNYLSNGAFYMYLVAKRAKGIHDHPVIKRLVQFQNLYKRLVPVDERVKAELDDLLERINRGQDVGTVLTEKGKKGADKKRKRTKLKEGAEGKRRKTALSESSDEDDSGDDNQMAAQTGDQDDAVDDEERRAITYQMEKNKGLTAHKKKEARNPRVKHRTKYRRAKIRRKGQVRDFKPHKNLYSGEVTGIRAGIIRSRKMK